MKTAVEWFFNELYSIRKTILFEDQADAILKTFTQAKQMEKNNIDNKVIHFAEWLTKKHTTTLITLYENFEEQYYNETFKSE